MIALNQLVRKLGLHQYIVNRVGSKGRLNFNYIRPVRVDRDVKKLKLRKNINKV